MPWLLGVHLSAVLSQEETRGVGSRALRTSNRQRVPALGSVGSTSAGRKGGLG